MIYPVARRIIIPHLNTSTFFPIRSSKRWHNKDGLNFASNFKEAHAKFYIFQCKISRYFSPYPLEPPLNNLELPYLPYRKCLSTWCYCRILGTLKNLLRKGWHFAVHIVRKLKGSNKSIPVCICLSFHTLCKHISK
jgi:hypothetical protein